MPYGPGLNPPQDYNIDCSELEIASRYFYPSWTYVQDTPLEANKLFNHFLPLFT